MAAKATPVYARLHAKGLTLLQQNAVDLLALGKNDTEVAMLLGLHRTTVSKWRIYDPAFQAALNRVRAETWGVGLDRLRSLILEALNVIAETMSDPESPDRLKAAQALLKLVPLTPESFDPGPGDADEIVRRQVVERRSKKPSKTTNRLDRANGQDALEDECVLEYLMLRNRANGAVDEIEEENLDLTSDEDDADSSQTSEETELDG